MQATDSPDIEYTPDWLPADEADALFRALRNSIPWEVHRIKLFGREIDSPRLSCWIGDPGTDYKYSGVRFAPHPWPEALLPIRERLTRELGVPFNSVLANLYRSGADSMGWHSDDERELGPEPVIASLSLGAARRFVFQQRHGVAKYEIPLTHGGLLTMQGVTQREWRHALPQTMKEVGQRINLTFRELL
jgi:alkylated DNA repair dioxygenase AlkB